MFYLDDETEVDYKGTITIVKSEPLDLGGILQPRFKGLNFVALTNGINIQL